MTHELMKGAAVLTMVAVMVTAGLSSCSNEEEAMPTVVVASAVNTEVCVSIHDEDGKNLATDSVFLSRLRMDARDDKRTVYAGVKEIDGVVYISFGAPFPREDRIKWNADRTEGRCQEPVVLSHDRHKIVLGNNLFYFENPGMMGMMGGSLLTVESVAVGDTLILRNAEKQRIVVPLIFGNTGFRIERKDSV